VFGESCSAAEKCGYLIIMRFIFCRAIAGLDTKDCPLARDNQIWLSGKQISMQTCPSDNHIFPIFVDIQNIGQVKISFGQPVLTLRTSGSQRVVSSPA
jgi:hypothetical protein